MYIPYIDSMHLVPLPSLAAPRLWVLDKVLVEAVRKHFPNPAITAELYRYQLAVEHAVSLSALISSLIEYHR